VHWHLITLADVPPGERAACILRNPIDRFVSGFNSRLRQGAPRYDRPWSPGEAAAFERFGTPSALAEALAADDPAAREAMRDIRELSRPQTDWLPLAALSDRLQDLLWIGFTETLTADFERLKMRLSLPAEVQLPDDDVAAHRTPAGYSTTLGARGHAVLAEIFADDYRLIDRAREIAPHL
jgi:hypothetical protein